MHLRKQPPAFLSVHHLQSLPLRQQKQHRLLLLQKYRLLHFLRLRQRKHRQPVPLLYYRLPSAPLPYFLPVVSFPAASYHLPPHLQFYQKRPYLPARPEYSWEYSRSFRCLSRQDTQFCSMYRRFLQSSGLRPFRGVLPLPVRLFFPENPECRSLLLPLPPHPFLLRLFLHLTPYSEYSQKSSFHFHLHSTLYSSRCHIPPLWRLRLQEEPFQEPFPFPPAYFSQSFLLR